MITSPTVQDCPEAVHGPDRRRRRGVWAAVAALLVAAATWGGGGAAAAATSHRPPTAGAGAATDAGSAAGAVQPAAAAVGRPDFGPHVYVFDPGMAQSTIQATVDSIAAEQVPNQFGPQRYALLFEPGVYGSVADPLVFQVGYYTEVAGLGSSPGAVTVNGSIDVYNQCLHPTTPGTPNCTALDNFWRSVSNLTIHVTGGSGCRSGTDFWAVSQAAPMRRVAITGGNLSLMDYCSAGPQFASGGFIADSAFTGGTVINGSQQQFLVRDTALDGWSNGVWNQVFSGDPGAPTQTFSATSGLPGGTPPYTTLPTSPPTRERPFLRSGPSGYSVFVPALRPAAAGPSWPAGAAAGTSIPLGRFFIANPATPVWLIDAALAAGRDLLLTPGVYQLAAPIVVIRPDTVVLGLGFPTLIPRHGAPAVVVTDVAGAKLAGMIIDAPPVRSPVLLQVGLGRSARRGGDPADPTLLADVFFRVGGAEAGQATDSLVVDASHVILDDIWAWRADHGTGVGWTANVADTGIVVNGNDVTAHGLFVEHYQKTEVIWNGQDGTVVFFQNEMPYDPPSQAAWKSTPTTDGYPALRVSRRVRTFHGYGMGSYCFFDLGVPIHATRAFRVPRSPGIHLTDTLTRFLNGSGGIDHVINTTGAPVNATRPGPSDVVTYP